MAQSNQQQLAVMNAVTNFFESPFEAIANANARRKFQKVASETLATENAVSPATTVQCDPSGAPLPESALSDLLNIPHISCQCEAWGTCVKEACACKVLCPDNFHIFRRNGMTSVQSLTNEDDSLAFRNYTDPEPVEGRIRSTNGICWGHAAVTQKFNRVAFFKPDSRPPYQINSSNPDERKKAIRFYKKLIDDVIDNKASEIPGYANLKAFSDDPEFSNYFKDKVTREWADRAMSWQGLRVAISDEPQPREHNERIFAEARRRLTLNQQPNLVFTEENRRFFTHASLISHEETINGKTVLCMRDNNYDESFNAICGSYVYVNPEGKLMHSIQYGMARMERTIAAVDLAFNDERDAMKQMKSLYKKCTSEKGCPR